VRGEWGTAWTGVSGEKGDRGGKDSQELRWQQAAGKGSFFSGGSEEGNVDTDEGMVLDFVTAE